MDKSAKLKGVKLLGPNRWLTGRFGYAIDRALLYAKGALAWANER
jgi:hypothetical protein